MRSFANATNETKGTWFAVSSGLLYGLLGYFGVSILASGTSAYNLSFWRFLVASGMIAVIVFLRKKSKKINIKVALSSFANGALFYNTSGTLFFIASTYIATGQAMVIFFIYPVWVMLFNCLFLKHPVKAHYFFSAALIFGGLILLVDMERIDFNLIGLALSVISSISYAAYVLWSKRIPISPLPSTMLVSLGCAFSAFAMALIDGSLTLPNGWAIWFDIFCLALFCSAIPILLLLEALKYLSSDKASLLSVSEPLFSVIFGVILLGEQINQSVFLGIIFILLGALTVIVNWPQFVMNKWRKPL